MSNTCLAIKVLDENQNFRVVQIIFNDLAG